MNVKTEPKIGTRREARDGRVWIKARALGERAWGDALCEALAQVRTTGAVTEDHVRAMGYEPAGGGR